MTTTPPASPPSPDPIARAVRAELDATGMSALRLSQLAQVAQSGVYQWLAGTKGLMAGSIVRILRALPGAVDRIGAELSRIP